MEFVVFTGVLLFIFLFMIVQELMQAKKELEYKNRDMKDTIKDTIEWLKEKKYI